MKLFKNFFGRFTQELIAITLYVVGIAALIIGCVLDLLGFMVEAFICYMIFISSWFIMAIKTTTW